MKISVIIVYLFTSWVFGADLLFQGASLGARELLLASGINGDSEIENSVLCTYINQSCQK